MAKCLKKFSNRAKASYFHIQNLLSPVFSAGVGRVGIWSPGLALGTSPTMCLCHQNS